eukprot:751194-Hanusia_phi.AAC.1
MEPLQVKASKMKRQIDQMEMKLKNLKVAGPIPSPSSSPLSSSPSSRPCRPSPHKPSRIVCGARARHTTGTFFIRCWRHFTLLLSSSPHPLPQIIVPAVLVIMYWTTPMHK